MKKIVLTGGTHTGKTSILHSLRDQGYTVIGEVAQENMQLLMSLLGKTQYQTWRQDNFLAFQTMNIISNLEVYQNSLQLENTKDNLIFYDRGVFDWLGSLTREGIELPDNIKQLIQEIHYDMIYIIDPLELHNSREETGRMLDQSTSLRWAKAIKSVYSQQFGDHTVTQVPNIQSDTTQESIEKRRDFILKSLKEKNEI